MIEKNDKLLEPEVRNNIDLFMEPLIKDGFNCRYASYDLYHNFFKENFDDNQVTDDSFALRLFYYLASWGMLRGDSFLSRKSYKFLVGLSHKLRNGNYKYLIDFDPYSGNLDKYKTDVETLKKEIKDYFSNKNNEFRNRENEAWRTIVDKNTKKIKNEHPTIKETQVSDTLIGKILLGSYGCIPAYDDYDRNALIEYKRKGYPFCETISKNGLDDLLTFAVTNKEKLQEAREYYRRKGFDYPIMKYVDEVWWIKGMPFAKEKEEKSKRQSTQQPQ